MALEYDPTVRPHTPARQRELLQAVYQANAEDETDWLEWKREADLLTKADQFKVAKMILGLANRTVADAHRFVEGFGYVIVGMEPGRIEGTAQLDAADVDSRLAKYLGSQGLGWDLGYHTLEESSVMLITVRPPRAGDRIFTLQKSFHSEERGQGFEAGAIFVRSQTKTKPASPEQIETLTKRALDGATGPDAEIEIECLRGVVRVKNVQGFKDAWIKAEEHRLLDPLPKPPPTPRPERTGRVDIKDLVDMFGATSAADLAAQGVAFDGLDYATGISKQFADIGAPLRYKEERDEHEYRTAVADYLEALRSYSFSYELTEALDELEPGLCPEFTVINRSEVNLEELDVDIHLPGDVIGFEIDAGSSAERPNSPRRWNVAPKGHPSRQFEDLYPQINFPNIPDIHVGDLGPGPTKPPFRNSGSVDLNYFLTHLRPVASKSLERGKVLVAASDRRAEILASWQATARNADKLFTGTVLVPVREIDAASLLQRPSQ